MKIGKRRNQKSVENDPVVGSVGGRRSGFTAGPSHGRDLTVSSHISLPRFSCNRDEPMSSEKLTDSSKPEGT